MDKKSSRMSKPWTGIQDKIKMFESKNKSKEMDSKKEKEALKELERLRKQEEDNALKELERLRKQEEEKEKVKKFMEKMSRSVTGLELQIVELDYIRKKEQERMRNGKNGRSKSDKSNSDKSKSDSKKSIIASMKKLAISSKPNKLVRKTTMKSKK